MHDRPSNEVKPVRFDPRLRDTEWGWMRRVDRYAEIVVPVWFTLLEWIALLGVLEFVHRKSGSKILGVIVALSLVAMWRYVVALVGRVEFIGFAPKASARTQFWISEGIGGLITTGAWLLAYHCVNLIAQFTSNA
jgi:hypothetical protein